jgi:hypothetical protein
MTDVLHLEGLRRYIQNAHDTGLTLDTSLFAVVVNDTHTPSETDTTMATASSKAWDGTFANGGNGTGTGGADTASPLEIDGADVSITLDTDHLELTISGNAVDFGNCSADGGTDNAGWVAFYLEESGATADTQRFPLISHQITVQPVSGNNYSHITDSNGLFKLKVAT